jgi:lysozyme family protein
VWCSWIDAELQRRRQRWEQRQEELRQQADAEAQERQQQAERLAELRQQQRQQEDAPPVQQLSAAALAQMGRHKLLQCTTALVEAGFDLNHAVVAAGVCGGRLDSAT